MKQKFCQSCGMPLAEEILGTNADGSKSQDYCIYCYKDGAFTGDFTMEEMVEYCSMFVDEYNKNTGQQLTCCEYKEVLRKFYPSLKRWNLPADAIPHADHPLKKIFIAEVNALGLPELHIDNLYVLQARSSIKLTTSTATRSSSWTTLQPTGAIKSKRAMAAATASPAMRNSSSSANTGKTAPTPN